MDGGPARLQVRGPVCTGGGSWDAGWCHLPGLELESCGACETLPSVSAALPGACAGDGGFRLCFLTPAQRPVLLFSLNAHHPGFETRVSVHTCFLLLFSP